MLILAKKGNSFKKKPGGKTLYKLSYLTLVFAGARHKCPEQTPIAQGGRRNKWLEGEVNGEGEKLCFMSSAAKTISQQSQLCKQVPNAEEIKQCAWDEIWTLGKVVEPPDRPRRKLQETNELFSSLSVHWQTMKASLLRSYFPFIHPASHPASHPAKFVSTEMPEHMVGWDGVG